MEPVAMTVGCAIAGAIAAKVTGLVCNRCGLDREVQKQTRGPSTTHETPGI